MRMGELFQLGLSIYLPYGKLNQRQKRKYISTYLSWNLLVSHSSSITLFSFSFFLNKVSFMLDERNYTCKLYSTCYSLQNS